jgi:hypothetical protein
MIDKTLVRKIGARSYELGPMRMMLSLAPTHAWILPRS